MIRRRISSVLTVFAGAALFIGTSAVAQMNPGQTAPQNPSKSNANPNANPKMNNADTMQQQTSGASQQMQDKVFVRKAM